jgi:hypothetical protein
MPMVVHGIKILVQMLQEQDIYKYFYGLMPMVAHVMQFMGNHVDSLLSLDSLERHFSLSF